jgi:bacteriocin-like protein
MRRDLLPSQERKSAGNSAGRVERNTEEAMTDKNTSTLVELTETELNQVSGGQANIHQGSGKTVVSRRHFFSVAPDWRHVTGTMMAALGDLRGFVGGRR